MGSYMKQHMKIPSTEICILHPVVEMSILNTFSMFIDGQMSVFY